MFGKIKKSNKSKNMTRGAVGNQQRVVSYYTASPKQIDSFERVKLGSVSKKRVWKNNFFLIITVFLVVILLYALIAIPGGARVVVKDGGAYRQNSEYTDIVNGILSSSWKNNFKPLVDRMSLEEEIKNSIPEANNVSINIPILGQNPLVEIETAAPFAVVNQANSPSYVVTDRGRAAIDLTKTVIDTTKLSSIKNNSGTIVETGNQLFKPTEMDAIKELMFQFKSSGQDQVPFIIPEQPREIHVQNGNYVVRFSLDTGPTTSLQFGAMKAVQQEISRGLQAPPTNYIDVRLGDKIFLL